MGHRESVPREGDRRPDDSLMNLCELGLQYLQDPQVPSNLVLVSSVQLPYGWRSLVRHAKHCTDMALVVVVDASPKGWAPEGMVRAAPYPPTTHPSARVVKRRGWCVGHASPGTRKHTALKPTPTPPRTFADWTHHAL